MSIELLFPPCTLSGYADYHYTFKALNFHSCDLCPYANRV